MTFIDRVTTKSSPFITDFKVQYFEFGTILLPCNYTLCTLYTPAIPQLYRHLLTQTYTQLYARIMLAGLNYAKCENYLDKALAIDGQFMPAIVAKAQMLLKQNDVASARQ